MRVKKVSIYIRLCDQPGRPFERLKVRNPRQCGKRDYYCLRVGGKFEFFAEQDAARKDLNEALHRKGEREHELRIGVAAPLIPQRTVAQPGKTPVADAVQKHFDNLEAMGKDPKTIRTYRAAVNGFLASYKKPFIEDYERQHLIDYMGWLRKQPRKQRKHANPDRTYFNKVSHVAIFLKACGVRPGLQASEYPSYHEKQVVAHTDEELAVLYREADEDERFLLDFFIGTNGARPRGADGEVLRLDRHDAHRPRKAAQDLDGRNQPAARNCCSRTATVARTRICWTSFRDSRSVLGRSSTPSCISCARPEPRAATERANS